MHADRQQAVLGSDAHLFVSSQEHTDTRIEFHPLALCLIVGPCVSSGLPMSTPTAIGAT